MQPTSEFEFQLFRAAGAPQDRIMTFSCGHIIPPHHVLPLVLSRGPSNKELNFSWNSRISLMDELANLLLNVNQVNKSMISFILHLRCSIILLGCFRRCGLFPSFVRV